MDTFIIIFVNFFLNQIIIKIKCLRLDSEHPLKKILFPNSIAFLGASNNLTTMGTMQLINIINGGFKGKVYPIHPNLNKIFHLPVYKKLENLPEIPDLVIMVIPTKLVPEFLEDMGKQNINRAIIITAGFKEIGEEKRQIEIQSIANRYGIRFLGPNCLGVCNTHYKFNTTWIPFFPPTGNITIISQSGSYSSHFFPYVQNLGLGLNATISVGNEANLDIVDCLEYCKDDPNTKAIGMYIEGIRRGKKFIEVAREVSKTKPIVATYVGGTDAGARSSRSHTAVISGNHKIISSVFKQNGIVEAESIEQVLNFTWALSTQPLLKGNRILVLTNSGGPGTAMGDRAERIGLKVPILSQEIQTIIKNKELIPFTGTAQNPIDLTFSRNFEHFFFDLPKILLKSDEIDGMLFYGFFGGSYLKHAEASGNIKFKEDFNALEQLQKAMINKFIKLIRKLNKPVLFSSLLGRKDEIVSSIQDQPFPVYYFPETAVDAMKALWEYSKYRLKIGETV